MKNLASIRGFKNASIGTIMAWTGTTSDIPQGWLSCDGSTHNNADYPALQSVIGTTYGGGGSTFAVPTLNTIQKVPVHQGSAYDSATGGASSENIVLNAEWLIENKPNKTVAFSSPAAITGNGAGGAIWSKAASMQPRVLSHENMPSHTHTYTIQTCNPQTGGGSPSAESGGDASGQVAGALVDKEFQDVGAPNSDEFSSRTGGAGGAHSHGSIQYSVDKGTINIDPYTRDYDEVNSTVALNNNPGIGNSQLAMNTPYQTAIYIIKAF